LALVLVQSAWCIGMTATTVRIWWLSTIFGLLAVGAVPRLLPFVLGKVAAGGVFLTPSGIEQRFGARTTFLWQAHLGTCRSLEWQPWSPSAVTFHRKDRQTRPPHRQVGPPGYERAVPH
jgi:hypothetical protein